MDLVSTGPQLLIVLLFVLPGTVFQAARARLRGPNPADRDATSRILRAMAASTVLNAVYLLLFGPQLVRLYRDVAAALGDFPGAGGSAADAQADVARTAGLVALALLFVVPVALAGLDYWRTRWDEGRMLARRPWLRVVTVAYDPTPRAWDFAFGARTACFVRVLTGDGQWVGGWFGPRSFAASYPEPTELYLEQAWILDEFGSFVTAQDGSSGLYVRCDDARVVEFLAPVEADAGGGAP